MMMSVTAWLPWRLGVGRTANLAHRMVPVKADSTSFSLIILAYAMANWFDSAYSLDGGVQIIFSLRL